MSFRLLCHAPFAEDGTSQYRAWGPITELRKLIPDLDVISVHTLASSASGTRLAWPEIKNLDAVMLQRPFAGDHVMIAHMAKKYKKPLWVDFDDDLLAVPSDNPTHYNYATPEVARNIEQLCAMSDIVTVSNKFLGAKLAKYNPKVLVVPNALDLNVLTRLDQALPRNKLVLWRGSHCHFTDLHEYTEQLLAAYREFPDWSWAFVGYNPTWITKHMDMQKRCRVLPFDNDYLNFMSNMQRLRAAVQIVPLVTNDFNLSKSRIAHLEGSLAGSAILAPDWEEWQEGKLYRYSGADDFKEKLFHMLASSIEQLAEVNNQDWDWVVKNRSLNGINEFRRGIIEAFRR